MIPNMAIGAWLGISEVGNDRHEAGRTIRLPVRHRVLAQAGCAVQSNLVYSPRRKDLCCRHGAFSEADPFIFLIYALIECSHLSIQLYLLNILIQSILTARS